MLADFLNITICHCPIIYLSRLEVIEVAILTYISTKSNWDVAEMRKNTSLEDFLFAHKIL